jgi:two-component system, LytTR family, response regulator
MRTQKTSIVLVDDDNYALDTLSKALDGFEDVMVMRQFNNATQAVEFLLHHRPDLLLLDIQMPELNGFDVLDRLGQEAPEVIFVTSYDEYALRAIRYSALDYLLKPVLTPTLREALDRYHQRQERWMSQLRLANLRYNLSVEGTSEPRLVFLTKQGERQFAAKEIIRCEGESNYTWIHLKDGKKFLASKTLSDVEGMLGNDHFLRIHKSHIINTSHIQRITMDSVVVMCDETCLRISRRRMAEIKPILDQLHW